jgi:hypothetical protein
MQKNVKNKKSIPRKGKANKGGPVEPSKPKARRSRKEAR